MIHTIKNWNIDNIDNKVNKLINNSIKLRKSFDSLDDEKFLLGILNDIHNTMTFCSICNFIHQIGDTTMFNYTDLFNNKLIEADEKIQTYIFESEYNKPIYERLVKIKSTGNKLLLKKIINIFEKIYINNDVAKKLKYFIFNEKNIIKLMQYKHAYAKLYGFKNYASFMLKNQLITSAKKIIQIIKLLLNATDELYKNMNKKKLITNISTYFPVDLVIKNTFELMSNFFCIDFKLINTVTWNNDVCCYSVISDDKIIGYLYLDLFNRNFKISHNSCICINVNFGENIISQMAILMNIDTNYQYMTFENLLSFYHELGHAIHAMFGNGLMSGIYMENDFVEIIGHLMELFCLDKLQYISDNKLPKNIENDIIKNHKHNKCISIREQCLITFYDIYMHSYNTFKQFCVNFTNKKEFDNDIEHVILKYACNELYNYILGNENNENNEINETLTKYIDIKNNVMHHNFIIGQICAHNIYSQYKTKMGLLKKKLFEIGGKEKGITILTNIIQKPFTIEGLSEYYDFDICENKFTEIKCNRQNTCDNCVKSVLQCQFSLTETDN